MNKERRVEIQEFLRDIVAIEKKIKDSFPDGDKVDKETAEGIKEEIGVLAHNIGEMATWVNAMLQGMFTGSKHYDQVDDEANALMTAQFDLCRIAYSEKEVTKERLDEFIEELDRIEEELRDLI